MTSTKGHFGNSTFKETVENWLSHCPAEKWGRLICHIKVSNSDNPVEMNKWLTDIGFQVFETKADWKHHDSSHSNEYLKDLKKMSFFACSQPYSIFVEDDFLLHINSNTTLDNLLTLAQDTLSKNSQNLEFRFPRFNNEIERIRNLKAKHNIDAEVEESLNKTFFWHSENANFHPCVRRSRDIMIALKLLSDNWQQLQGLGVEQGFSRCFKMLSYTAFSLLCCNPDIAQCLHIGVRTPEERDVAGKVFDK